MQFPSVTIKRILWHDKADQELWESLPWERVRNAWGEENYSKPLKHNWPKWLVRSNEVPGDSQLMNRRVD